MATCYQCLEPIRTGAVRCPHCHQAQPHDLVEAQIRAEERARAAAARERWIVRGVWIVLALFLLGMCAYG